MLTLLPIKSEVSANVSSETPTFFDAQCLHLPLAPTSRLPTDFMLKYNI